MDWLYFDKFIELSESGVLKSLFVQISIIFSLAIIIDISQRKIIKQLTNSIAPKKVKYILFNSFITTSRFPITWILYIMAVTVSLGLLNTHLDIGLLSKFKDLRGLGILSVLGGFSLNFIKELKRGKLEEIDLLHTNKDKTTIQVAANVANIIVFIILGMMALQELGLSVSGLMAFGGIGGLVVGLSAKEFLSDFFGGLILIADKPFKVGDWIRSPDRDIEGTVEEIGMRRICVRTFDKRPLYIPNSILSTITIENPSRMSNRRIKETIGIRYEDAEKMSQITRRVREMLESHSGIDNSLILMVNFNAYNESSLDFFIYCFTKTTDWKLYHGVKHNVLLSIYEIIKEEKADIAFPTSIVHLEKKNSHESLIQMMEQDLKQ